MQEINDEQVPNLNSSPEITQIMNSSPEITQITNSQYVNAQTNSEHRDQLQQNQLDLAINQSLNQYSAQVYTRKNRLKKSYIKHIKRMKIGRTTQACTICLSRFQKAEVINMLPCEHIVHKKCCSQWFKVNQRCPVCRYHIGVHFLNLGVQRMKVQQNQVKFQAQKNASKQEGDQCQ